MVSDFGETEFVSAIGRKTRMRLVTDLDALRVIASFNQGIEARCELVRIESPDLDFARSAMRRFDLGLRSPDAIHVAIAMRLGAERTTFDLGLQHSARSPGIRVGPP